MPAIWHTSNNVLRDAGQPVLRSKTFNIPVTLKSCKINTIYTFFVNGINMGYCCKPFGGTLGGNLLSDVHGVLKFQFLYDQRHSLGIIGNSNSASQVLSSQLKCQAIDPMGIATTFYLPVSLKPTQ